MEGFGNDDVRARAGDGGGYGGDYGAGGGLMGGDREAGSDDWTHGRRGGGGAADRVESGYYTRESHSGYYVRSKASKDEDDDGHGADAWTSSIEFEADGSQRVVKLGEEPDGSRPQGRPPSKSSRPRRCATSASRASSTPARQSTGLPRCRRPCALPRGRVCVGEDALSPAALLRATGSPTRLGCTY